MKKKEQIETAHTIAREFFVSLNKHDEAKSIIPTDDSSRRTKTTVFFEKFSCITCIICGVWFLFLMVFFSVVQTAGPVAKSIIIALSVVIGLLTTVAFVIWLSEYPPYKPRTWDRPELEIDDLMTDELEVLKENHKSIFSKVEQSLLVALEDGTKESFIPMLYGSFLIDLLLSRKEMLLRERAKRLAITIAHGTFIIESLDLGEVAREDELQKSLTKVFDSYNELREFEDSVEKPNLVLMKEFQRIKKNYSNIASVIENITKVKTDATVSKGIMQDTERLKELTKAAPIAKSNISFKKASKGISKAKLLPTITALDDEVVEIRTRAGTYYASVANIRSKDIRKQREIELLTDKELEVKISVINTTLEMLDEERESMSQKEFLAIKKEHLATLFATRKALERRKGSGKKIICPSCSQENSAVQDYCISCGTELPYCIVCLSSIGKGEKVSTCPLCDSYAHANHFDEWLTKSSKCPYCRKEIKEKLDKIILEQISKV